MPQVKFGSRVKLHLTGMDTHGGVFFSTAGRDAISLTIGQGRLMPALEQEIIGMGPGEAKTLEIPAKRAFGSRHPDKVIKIGGPHPHTGPSPGILRMDQVDSGTEGEYTLIVDDRDESGRIIIDLNSPLAGQNLVFNVEIEEIVT